MYTCFYYSTEKTDLRNLRAGGKKSKVDTLSVQAKSAVSIPIQDLKAETTYYYAPALSIQGFEVMSDMRAFTTAKFCHLQPATEISASGATLNALISLPEEMVGNCVIAFEYTQKDFELSKESIEAAQPDEEGKVSVALTGLQTGTKYYFRAYVLYNAVRIYSDVLYFQTL